MSRKKIFIANWKMHKSASEAQTYVSELLSHVHNLDGHIYLSVPFTMIRPTSKVAAHSALLVGAQNVFYERQGAFTGEISADMLLDAGARFCLVGHSERRQLFNETDADVHKKTVCLLKNKLQPVVCIGETDQQREQGHTKDILENQLKQALSTLSDKEMKKIIIAYEPIWAIGTGNVASPDTANAAHQMIRSFIAQHWDKALAEQISILYGGSVKDDNVQTLMNESDIDGALVGGASLDPIHFARIITKGL